MGQCCALIMQLFISTLNQPEQPSWLRSNAVNLHLKLNHIILWCLAGCVIFNYSGEHQPERCDLHSVEESTILGR